MGSVPPASRGNLEEGVVNCCFFCELWFDDWYQRVREFQVERVITAA
jgi:heterodisulfide reductase subunit B